MFIHKYKYHAIIKKKHLLSDQTDKNKNGYFLMKSCKTLFLILIPILLVACSSAKASTSEDAINCSALFFIMTTLTNNDQQFGMRMTMASMRMGYVYAMHEKSNNGKGITNGDVLGLRDRRAKELGHLYDKRPEAVVNKYMFCSQWYDAVIKYIKQYGESVNILNIPSSHDFHVANAIVKDSDRQQVKKAFKEWDNTGRITREDVKKMLRKSIDNSK